MLLMDRLGGMHVLVGMPQSKSAAMSPDTAGAGNPSGFIDAMTNKLTVWDFSL